MWPKLVRCPSGGRLPDYQDQRAANPRERKPSNYGERGDGDGRSRVLSAGAPKMSTSDRTISNNDAHLSSTG